MRRVALRGIVTERLNLLDRIARSVKPDSFADRVLYRLHRGWLIVGAFLNCVGPAVFCIAWFVGVGYLMLRCAGKIP